MRNNWLILWSTICAKSSLLLLAQIQVVVQDAPRRRPKGHVRQKSEDLIEDLEVELGDTQLEYLHINVTYSHSAFPSRTSVESVGGVFNIQSKVKTTATATLKLRNTFSPWSPPPAPGPNPLFQLIERHWGAGKATERIRQILDQDSASDELTPPERAYLKSIVNDDDTPMPATPVSTVPVVPARHASWQQQAPITKASNVRGFWDESASAASVSTKRGRRNCSRGSDNPIPSRPSVDQRPADIYDTHRGDGQGDPIWKRPSFGTDTIRGLLPFMTRDLSMACPDRQTSKSSQVEIGRAKSKKEGNRWSWGGWF